MRTRNKHPILSSSTLALFALINAENSDPVCLGTVLSLHKTMALAVTNLYAQFERQSVVAGRVSV